MKNYYSQYKVFIMKENCMYILFDVMEKTIKATKLSQH